jgi:hypothetical protein
MQYDWGNGYSTIPTNTVSALGIYNVTVKDPSNGCTALASIDVQGDITEPAVTINAASDTLTCNMQTVTATATATGGTAPYTFTWSTTENGQEIQISIAATYTVIATGSNGCTTSAFVEIAEDKTPFTIPSDFSPIYACKLPYTLPEVPGATTYGWMDGSQPITVITTLGDGPYFVTAAGANGCPNVPQTVTINLAETDTLLMGTHLSMTPASSADALDGIAQVDISGVTILWANGETGQSIVVGSGSYTVTVTFPSGCTASGVVEVGLVGLDVQSIYDYQIYPTLTNDIIHIDFTSTIADKVLIMNSIGQVVSQFNNLDSRTTIDLRQYGRGQYLVSLFFKNAVDTHTIILMDK